MESGDTIDTHILIFVLPPYTCLKVESLSCDPGMKSARMMVTQETRKNSLCTSRLCLMRKKHNKSLICVHHHLVGFCFLEMKSIMKPKHRLYLELQINISKFETLWIITLMSFCTSLFMRTLSMLKPLLGSRTTAFT